MSRREFLSRLDRAIDHSGRSGVASALLFFDIDHFKVVNDSMGHSAGDDLINSIADRVRKLSPAEATAARLGGDKFAVLLENIPDLDYARQFAETLREACARPHDIRFQSIEVTISAGLVTSSKGYTSDIDLLRDVDIAMYEGKKSGRNCLVEFDAQMHQASKERHDLKQDLRQALASDELHLAYQPIVDLATGKIVSAEALARWTHTGRGVIPPYRFIPIAEDSGMIERLGDWVIDQSLGQLVDWRRRGVVGERFALSVNISKKQLLNPMFPQKLSERVAEHGLSPRDLKIEVTETTIVDNRTSVNTALCDLREREFTIMMDDFGTGHSSLSGLQSLPIDELKIDQSFLHNAEMNADAIAIMSAIATLAGHLSLNIVAEGIETKEQLALLQSLDCQFGQGYHFSRPVDARAFQEWLDDGKVILAA